MIHHTNSVLRTLIVALALFSPGHSSQSLALTNVTSPSALNFTDVAYVCDPVYGRDLDKNSCLDALMQMSTSETPVTLGQRGTGSNIALPYRILSDEGGNICIIQIRSRSDHLPDTWTWNQMRQSTYEVLVECVERRAMGGTVLHGGKNGQIDVAILSDERTAECQSPATGIARPPYASCQELLSRMPATTEQQNFGYAGMPWADINVKLPKILYSRDSECALGIGVNEGQDSDTSSWGAVWAAAVQINELCVKNGAAGIDDTFGDFEALNLVLFRPDPTSKVATS